MGKLTDRLDKINEKLREGTLKAAAKVEAMEDAAAAVKAEAAAKVKNEAAAKVAAAECAVANTKAEAAAASALTSATASSTASTFASTFSVPLRSFSLILSSLSVSLPMLNSSKLLFFLFQRKGITKWKPYKTRFYSFVRRKAESITITALAC